VDLSALMNSVLGLYRARLKNSEIVAVNDSAEDPTLFCYEGELRQVVLNLVSNALDAMRTGGRLTIRNRNVTLLPSGVKGVRITVADTGSGMDQTTIERIFEPFFSTKGIGGTGLGLWIAKDLIEKNEGRIQIRSRIEPGRSGTVVSLYFPRQPQLESGARV
jgi:signal transduction histidine kinase